MLAAISIVGQHPRGLQLHAANLKWAIDCPVNIYVFTFREWGLTPPNGISLIEVEGSPSQWKEFWDEDAPKVKGVNDIPGRIQLWFEFTMYCLYNKHVVKQVDFLSHFNSVETIHRMHPAIYEDGDISKIKEVNQSPAKYAGALFLYYLSDVIPMTDHLKNVFQNSDSLFILNLLKLNTEWMSPNEKEKTNNVKEMVIKPRFA